MSGSSSRLPEAAARLYVESRRGLVEEEQVGAAGQREGEANPLGLAAGQLLHPPVGDVGETGQPEQVGLAAPAVIELAEQRDQLGDLRAVRQAAGLDHPADLPGSDRGRRSHAEHPNVARGGLAQAEHGVDGRGFPGPVRPEQRDRRAAGDLEADVIKGGDPPGVDLRHVAEHDGRACLRVCCLHDSHARCRYGAGPVPRITNRA
jgi:hypothetical protein